MYIKKIAAIITAGIVSVTAVSVTAFAAGNKVPITEKYFPDENFREYAAEFDTNGDNWLSQKERDAVAEMDVSDKEIGSLKGIEKFKKLEKLVCYGNKLKKLDVSSNTKLSYLNCTNCDLTELDVSKNTKLEELSCCRNKLTKLDVSKNTKHKELA